MTSGARPESAPTTGNQARTSGGIRNPSIHDALVDMLGKPIAEASALCIPTAGYANSNGAVRAWAFISAMNRSRVPATCWAKAIAASLPEGNISP